MPEGSAGVLLVEHDLAVADTIVRHLAETLRTPPTHARSAPEALQRLCERSYEVAVCDLSLPDAPGLDLIRRLRSVGDPAVIALADEPTVENAIEAIRLGVTDLFAKPVDLDRLGEAVRNALEHRRRQRREQLRQRRLRELTSRIVRERRALRQRTDLICRDLVHAYRRLAEKVVDVLSERDL